MRRRVSSLVKVRPAGAATQPALGLRVPLVALVQALAVAEHLNFRHAADALGISQSSVSTRIKQLEQDLGVQLFERRHRGVRLTEAGQHFLEHVATGIEHLDHAVRTAGAIARGERGRLRVGLYSSIFAGFLAELLGQFRGQYPTVDLQIMEGRARDTIRAVREARLDVAFVVGVPKVSDCHSKPLWTEALFVALPERHALAEAEGVTWPALSGASFLARTGGPGPQVHDHIVLRLAGHWCQPRIQRFDVERDTLMSMVAQGYGITLTSEAAAQVPFPGVVFRPVLDETELITFSALWSPHNRCQTLLHLLALAEQKSEGRSLGI
ncbi:LysR family transcriptional regulator [Rhodopseudomonas palustris]|nr:LysR family transcriptional regulator [Rhodopseudomonas palustris]OPF92769.1 LysR family transcriptional regulator [Rhodopseudomonas palustris]RJF63901.1 LysR family transcriptional regulator [Rhodopseudomonas palustris]WAB77005.1 LysR substrate-binding domain-containing protein [Rhodopseudomonas palustris]WCL94301.1 LysR substrate-binding domain-containing protein [Rhodopseudomonas palustris CGA009]WND50917.1 LysR substrate-binding domain-containing protein [Rhodopseudomonas palustris]